jgi:nitrate reductase gamma subunit
VSDLLFVGLPYAAFAVFVAGLIVRFRHGVTVTSQSSQILESRLLLWGTIPFHLGIFVLVAGHVLPLLFPQTWRQLVAQETQLIVVESLGMAAALLCLFGLVMLLVRRLFSDAVRSTSRVADVVVLAVLIGQVLMGLAVATMHRWGAVWAVGTVVPYLRSLIAFRPDLTFVAGLPRVMQWHLAGAWIVLALIPFTRLVHIFTFPITYLGRRPQKVVWTTRARRSEA